MSGSLAGKHVCAGPGRVAVVVADATVDGLTTTMSSSSIMNANRRYPSRGYRHPRLRPFRNQPDQPRTPTTCYRVLQEDGIEIPVPAIIDEHVFDAVQERLEENRQRHRMARKTACYLLQGLVVCKECGYAMCGRCIRESHTYYRCVGNVARRMTGERIYHNRSIRADQLEEAAWKDVCDLLQNPSRVKDE